MNWKQIKQWIQESIGWAVAQWSVETIVALFLDD